MTFESCQGRQHIKNISGSRPYFWALFRRCRMFTVMDMGWSVMFTLSVITTLFAAITVESLILYYPVYPNYVVPKHMQNFERNAPPRIFAKDPDIPSSGIVFLKKDFEERLSSFPAQSDVNDINFRQKLHSNQKLGLNRPVLSAALLNSAEVQASTTPSFVMVNLMTLQVGSPARCYKCNEVAPKSSLTQASRSFHEGHAQLVSFGQTTMDPLSTQSVGQLASIKTSKIPNARPLKERKSKSVVIDSDAIIKPLGLLPLERLV
uniref:Uncharacterized protein n=1 Tax=Setaria digitata TaxID=48799 RepID=A0A915PY82_9BILA